MKKRYGIELLGMIVLLLLPFFRVEKDVELATLQNLVEPYILKDTMEQSNETKIYRNYHISQVAYTECFSYSPISYMDVEEITIFKETDEIKRKKLVDAAQKHIERQISIFEGYGVEQTKLLQNAYVEEKGSYVILVVHPDRGEVSQRIEACFQ